jgi:hypothetical protein
MINDNKKGVVILATGNKKEFYDLIVSDILAGNIDLINEMVGKEIMVLLSYDTFSGKSGESYEGFDKLFKLDGLVELINRHFLVYKIDLIAKKDLYDNRNVIRLSRFARFERNGGEKFVSKTERITTKDNVEIVENSSKDSDKEKIAKKIEESRKLIQEG